MAEQTSKRKALNPLTMIASTARCCFSCFVCLRPKLSSPSFDSDCLSPQTSTQSHPVAAHGVGALKKAREWSEIAAGPRWKNFIRRFNKSRRSHSSLGKFHYDSLSYALNFDESSRDLESFDCTNEVDFSSKYACESSRNISILDENVA